MTAEHFVIGVDVELITSLHVVSVLVNLQVHESIDLLIVILVNEYFVNTDASVVILINTVEVDLMDIFCRIDRSPGCKAFKLEVRIMSKQFEKRYLPFKRDVEQII